MPLRLCIYNLQCKSGCFRKSLSTLVYLSFFFRGFPLLNKCTDHNAIRKMPTEERLQSCIQWAKDNAAIIDERVEFKVTPGSGVAAFCKTRVSSSEPLISVPKKLLLTNNLAREHFGIQKKSSSRNPNVFLQLYLSKLKFDGACDNAKFFKPYLDILPSGREVGSPYFWSPEEMDLLKGTDLFLKTKRNLANLVQEWFEGITQINQVTADAKAFYDLFANSGIDTVDYLEENVVPKWNSFPAYLWSTVIFTSRAFPQILLDQEATQDINEAFLFPIVDLLNHRNNTKVEWAADYKASALTFSTKETLNEGDELFNNYGDKSNEELLLGYGFALENNDFDVTTVTLKLPLDSIRKAQAFGVSLNTDDIIDDSINFCLSSSQPLPGTLISLFSFLCKLKSETSLSLRSTLEGLDQLYSILDQKLSFFKSSSKIASTTIKSPAILKQVKVYKNSQKRIFQESCDAVLKHQKELLKKYKPLSFKTVFKSDKPFANSLLLTFGVTSYEGLVTKNLVNQAVLLWLVRAGNMKHYKKLEYKFPAFICDTFESVKSNIVVEKEDVIEYMPFFKSLFPGLSTKIPEVYGYGDWGIKQFIVAGTVVDHLVWTRALTKESFLIERKSL